MNQPMVVQTDIGPNEDALMQPSDFRRLFSRKAEKRSWEPRTTPLRNQLSSGRYAGVQECNALGLIRGDCHEPAVRDGIYCYYHDKVVSGLMSPPAELYPIWPLPEVPWDFSAADVRLSA